MRFDRDRVEIFRGMVKQRWDSILAGFGDYDPIKVFVKQEPHKSSKLAEGRVRIISAVSVVDTMIDRILYGDLIETLPERRSPCKVGWAPVRGGHRSLTAHFPGRALSTDKTAFDWTVQPWLVDFWRKSLSDFAFESLGSISHSDWEKLHQFRFSKLFGPECLFRFKDGVEEYQGVWGIMKSGCYLTIALNSYSQVLAHLLAKYRLGQASDQLNLWAMGDDTLQDNETEDYFRELTGCGLIVKEHNFGVPSFAGYRVVPGGMVPEYQKKHTWIILHTPMSNLPELLHGYQVLYAYEPKMLSWIRSELQTIDPEKLRSERVLRSIFSEA